MRTAPHLHLLLFVLGRFPLSERTGRPDHCRTNQFDTEIYFFQDRVFAKKPSPLVHTIQDLTDLTMEIIIATGMVWPVSFDKWKAPLDSPLASPDSRCCFQ